MSIIFIGCRAVHVRTGDTLNVGDLTTYTPTEETLCEQSLTDLRALAKRASMQVWNTPKDKLVQLILSSWEAIKEKKKEGKKKKTSSYEAGVYFHLSVFVEFFYFHFIWFLCF